MNKNKLFDDSEDSEGDVRFNTNADYAKSYNKFRQKELLKKYKDQEAVASGSDSSSESESTDDDEALDPKFDQEFFKTLSSLKSKDPVIYDKKTRFFEGVDEVEAQKKKPPAKPVTLKDYERKIILENDGKFEESDGGDEETANNIRASSPTYVEEQRKLKAEFKKVINAENSDEEEFGGIFKKRVKSKEEKDKEEVDFTKWLAGKKDDVEEEIKKTLAPLKNYWSNSKLPQREKFLRDYILNQGYEKSNFTDIPTYEEIVGEDENISEDEEEVEKQEEFEHKYNFRFEEPDSEFIKRYPRTIEQSVRKQDDKRKQKRQETKERKEREKLQKMQELEMVKAMKRKEIEEKIKKLKEVTGNDELGFKDEELEDEFDPEKHDRRMQELFNDEYYEVDEGEDKPECPDIDELKVEDWDNFDPSKDYDDYEPHCEDDDFNMDCDYDPNSKETLQKELIESTRDKRKKRRRNRFMEVIKAEKPVFNPDDEKTYEEYIDEYYKLDCEDMIGDLPCRFKYTETTPNDFGLTIEEILLAKNKELNQWASLKKAVQIRPEYVEKKEQRLYRMKANNEFLKRKIFKSLYGEESEDETEDNQASSFVSHTQQPSQKNLKKRKVTETVTTEINGAEEEKIVAEEPKFGETVQEAFEAPIEIAEVNPEVATNTEIKPASSNASKGKKKKKNKNKNKPANGLNVDQSPKNQIPTADAKKSNQAMITVVNPFSNKQNVFVRGKLNNNKKNLSFKGTKNANQNNSSKNKDVFKHKASGDVSTENITDQRLAAYGINPRKFHKKQKYGNKPS